jgi:hypothetical protein
MPPLALLCWHWKTVTEANKVCARRERKTSGAIDTCINNVLIQAQRERTVVDEGAQQIFVVL